MEYIQPIISLAVCLLLFHFIFIYLFPQSKRFWKIVDYLWVSLGVLGIIGATFDSTKEIATAWQPVHKKTLEQVLMEYELNINEDVLDLSDTTSLMHFQAYNLKQKRILLRTSEVLNTVKYEINKNKDLILKEEKYYLIDTITKPYLSYINTISDLEIRETFSPTIFFCERTIEEGEALKTMQEKATRGEFNWLLLLISPYLFSIAIALRLTKVTAELKEIN